MLRVSLVCLVYHAGLLQYSVMFMQNFFSTNKLIDWLIDIEADGQRDVQRFWQFDYT